MPIRQFVNGAAFDPEAISKMSLALDDLRAEMGLRKRDDPATRLVASKITKFAQRGIRGSGQTAGVNAQRVQARLNNARATLLLKRARCDLLVIRFINI
jgi:hypothetical protein